MLRVGDGDWREFAESLAAFIEAGARVIPNAISFFCIGTCDATLGHTKVLSGFVF